MLISSNIKFTTTTVNDTTISATTPAGTTRTTTTTKLKIRKQKKYKTNSKKFLQQVPTHHHNLRQHHHNQHQQQQHQQYNFYDDLQIQSDDENDFLNLVPNSNPVKFLFEKFTTNTSANCNKIFLLKLCFLKNQFKKLKTNLESILSSSSSTSSIELEKLNEDYKKAIEIADHIITLLNFHIDYFINQEHHDDEINVDVDEITTNNNNNGNIRIRKRKIG